MSNVVYENPIENLRNRVDVKLISKETDSSKWSSKPSFVTQKIFNCIGSDSQNQNFYKI